jgi:hypothetical protein
LKVLYIIPYFPEPDKKAGSKFTYNQIKILSKMKYNIDLISITRFNKLDTKNLELLCSNIFIYKRKTNYFDYVNSVL